MVYLIISYNFKYYGWPTWFSNFPGIIFMSAVPKNSGTAFQSIVSLQFILIRPKEYLNYRKNCSTGFSTFRTYPLGLESNSILKFYYKNPDMLKYILFLENW